MLTAKRTKTISLTPASGQEKTDGQRGFFYPQLNGLRFLFIFMVLVHHWGPQAFFEQYRSGWLGVDLFFVLSGFLIGEILLREKEVTQNKMRSIGNFVMRRVLRIFPLYYLSLLLYAALVSTGGILIWNLTYANNILQAIDIERVGEEFWHLWSLCVEEQFYLVFPFFVFFVSRKRIPHFLVAGIALSVACRFVAAFVYQNKLSYTLMPLSLDSLFMGVALAYLKTHNSRQLTVCFSRRWLAIAGMIAASIGILFLCHWDHNREQLFIYTLFRFFGSVLGFLMIGYSVVVGYSGLAKSFLENRFIALLGKISYGIYLLHPFIEKLYRDSAASNPVRNFLIGLHKPFISNTYVIDFIFLFLTTVFVSYLSFQFFEKRFLKIKSLFS